ncbi:polymorphic toxin type 37 domain-containing protein [Paraburkholderia fungorum]|uniref:polymorphic toxin type 37 domain-containing protein n=1 Tax=Paraburkholderia fungorum TaxID=134537 RepID=UPI0038BDFDD9
MFRHGSSDLVNGITSIKPPANAYDPNGPKAPGKPSAADGFQDPKGGENWVPNPNPGRGGSWGWEDADGNVWCPTGQGGRAHGDPHWDIQGPGGKYGNMYPGGKYRPGKLVSDLYQYPSPRRSANTNSGRFALC